MMITIGTVELLILVVVLLAIVSPRLLERFADLAEAYFDDRFEAEAYRWRDSTTE